MDFASLNRSLGAALVAGLVLASTGCGTHTPYFLVQSRLVESGRGMDVPDVTETPRFRSIQARIARVGIRPPDVCADQGISTGGGAGQLQLGVLRTRCGVEMSELERALSRGGYEVVSWSALRQLVESGEIPLLDAAAELEIDFLLQVNALERIEARPSRDARWERTFFKATRMGEARDAVAVSRSLAESFDRLVAGKEEALASGPNIGASINVSGIWVPSGSAVWFYRWTRIDDVSRRREVDLLLDCEDEVCREVRRPAQVFDEGPVTGSIAGVSQAGDPIDESQSIFSELVRQLVADLARRLTGREI